MAWLLILLSAAALAAAYFSTSMALAILALLCSLILLLVGVIRLLADRAGSRIRDDVLLVDPAQLQRLREQAAVQRDVAATGTPGASTDLPSGR